MRDGGRGGRWWNRKRGGKDNKGKDGKCSPKTKTTYIIIDGSSEEKKEGKSLERFAKNYESDEFIDYTDDFYGVVVVKDGFKDPS